MANRKQFGEFALYLRKANFHVWFTNDKAIQFNAVINGKSIRLLATEKNITQAGDYTDYSWTEVEEDGKILASILNKYKFFFREKGGGKTPTSVDGLMMTASVGNETRYVNQDVDDNGVCWYVGTVTN